MPTNHPPTNPGVGDIRSKSSHTAQLNQTLTWTAYDSDQLGRTTAVVADGDDIVETASSLFDNTVEYIDETVGGGTWWRKLASGIFIM